MKYAVLLSRDPEDDLVDLYRYVAQVESVERAEHLLSRLERACLAPGQFPNRGRASPELESVGVMEFRQIAEPPYRILYRLTGQTVHVHAVLDGRRDLSDLLARRLLR
ncbi:MAG: type II toxin-antitoxin system RelE/ParE family toxin [Myxococcales bacterium]|nr:type II toxin-antitoxin system RelE/ParE family toxin [Myxococcales bacterium]